MAGLEGTGPYRSRVPRGDLGVGDLIREIERVALIAVGVRVLEREG